MAGLEDLLGAGDAVKQLLLWGVLNQVIGDAFAPYLASLTQDVQSSHPVLPLAPPDLADAVIRNYMTMAEATTEAARSGIDAARFATLVPLHGDAPGAQELAAGLLRGLIDLSGAGPDAVSFEQGIREGRLSDKWAPLIRGLAQQLLSPADAASAAVRNFLGQDQAAELAAKAGVDAATFGVLRHLAADAPAPGQLAEAVRRGLIPDEGTGPDAVSFVQGIAEGRLGDKWTDMIRGLAQIWPTPTDALAATLEGQVSADEGKALYERFGGDPQYFQLLFNTRGNAPTPVEALQLANRGIIPWSGTGPDATSYEQAFLEGPWRNKWLDPYKALGEYLPPPETTRALLEAGAIDEKQAAQWWSDYGMTQDTVNAYLNAAAFDNTAEVRGLTVSAVLDMFYAQLLDDTGARNLLDLFNVPPSSQDLLLAYVGMRRSIAAVQSAVSRLQSLYAARKITRDAASQALTRLKIPSATISDLIDTWDIEASVSVKLLTEAQIVDAWALQIITQDDAISELTAIGYTPYDAWVLLSIKAKGPLPNPPAKTVGAPLGAVIPGVT